MGQEDEETGKRVRLTAKGAGHVFAISSVQRLWLAGDTRTQDDQHQQANTQRRRIEEEERKRHILSATQKADNNKEPERDKRQDKERAGETGRGSVDMDISVSFF